MANVIYENSIYIQLCKNATILMVGQTCIKPFPLPTLYISETSMVKHLAIENNPENLNGQSLWLTNYARRLLQVFLAEKKNEYIRVI